MSSHDDPSPGLVPDSEPREHGAFLNTRWSQVLRAGDASEGKAAAALESLCRAYWHPLYAYLRRWGCGVEDAKDTLQSFFAWFLGDKEVRKADRARGKFRSFLLVRLRGFLSHEREKAGAEKRGGRAVVLSLDGDDTAEERYQIQPADHLTPDQIYDRAWADNVIREAREALRDECAADGHGMLYEELGPYLAGGEGGVGYAAVARRVGMEEPAVRKAIERLRKRWAALVREQIADTVQSRTEVEEELRTLMDILRPK